MGITTHVLNEMVHSFSVELNTSLTGVETPVVLPRAGNYIFSLNSPYLISTPVSIRVRVSRNQSFQFELTPEKYHQTWSFYTDREHELCMITAKCLGKPGDSHVFYGKILPGGEGDGTATTKPIESFQSIRKGLTVNGEYRFRYNDDMITHINHQFVDGTQNVKELFKLYSSNVFNPTINVVAMKWIEPSVSGKPAIPTKPKLTEVTPVEEPTPRMDDDESIEEFVPKPPSMMDEIRSSKLLKSEKRELKPLPEDTPGPTTIRSVLTESLTKIRSLVSNPDDEWANEFTDPDDWD